jgi:hypothetical protein
MLPPHPYREGLRGPPPRGAAGEIGHDEIMGAVLSHTELVEGHPPFRRVASIVSIVCGSLLIPTGYAASAARALPRTARRH